MASFHVSLRLNYEAWKRYSALAEVSDLPLGTFLRRRLELQDQVLAAEDLRGRAAKPAEVEGGKTLSPAVISGTLVELVLLLRSIAGPQRSAIAWKEVERQGMETWSGGSPTWP